MSTYTTAAGYERELPMLDDLDDFSIHEPSIRPGESVSGLEAEALLDLSEEMIWQFVLKHLAEVRAITERMHDTDFRFGMEHALDELDIRLTRAEYIACLDRALQRHPTSSGAGTRQDNEEPEEGALDDLSDIPIWLRKPNA